MKAILHWLRQRQAARLHEPRSSVARRRGRTRPTLEKLDDRIVLSAYRVPAAVYRPIDEVGNNVANPNWGVAGADLLRLSPAEYTNGYNSPSLAQDPSPRLISDIVNNQADPADPSQDIATVNQRSLSALADAFGQFMDHDMDLTLDNGASMPIPVPVGDPIGGPDDTPLAFAGSNTDPATGTGPGNPAQQVNSVTSYLDLSQVYGSDQATDDALRTFVGGRMKTSPGGLPPLDNTTYFTPAQLAVINASVGGMADAGSLPESDMFVTGDSRGNETIELTVLQSLFLDNHNRIATELHKEHPQLGRRGAFRGGQEDQHRRVPVDYLQRMDSRCAWPPRPGAVQGIQSQRQRHHRHRIFHRGIPLRPHPLERRPRSGRATMVWP